MRSKLFPSSPSCLSEWLAASCIATLFLAAVIPAMIYAAVFAFDLDDIGPFGISWVTFTFLVLFFVATLQALFAERNHGWPSLLNWFISIWLAYWLWGLAVNSFGYERPILGVLLSDNTHPAMWGFPLVLGLVWWLKPSGQSVRRGLDVALTIIFLIIGWRILLGSILPESQNVFGWSWGFGWWGLPFEQAPPLFDLGIQNAEWWRSYHFNSYGVQVRPSFVFEHANTLGFFAAFSLVYGIARSSRLGLILAAAAGAILIASTSQTSLVAATIGVSVYIFLRMFSNQKFRKIRLLLIMVPIFGIAVLAWLVGQRSPNLTGRVPQWRSVFANFNNEVFLGTGGELLINQVVNEQSTVGTDLHNSFLSTLAWSGLIGLALFIALWAVGLWLGVRAAKAGNLITLALLATCFVSSMTESTFAYRYWSMGNALLLVAVLLSQPVSTRARQLQPS